MFVVVGVEWSISREVRLRMWMQGVVAEVMNSVSMVVEASGVGWTEGVSG